MTLDASKIATNSPSVDIQSSLIRLRTPTSLPEVNLNTANGVTITSPVGTGVVGPFAAT